MICVCFCNRFSPRSLPCTFHQLDHPSFDNLWALMQCTSSLQFGQMSSQPCSATTNAANRLKRRTLSAISRRRRSTASYDDAMHEGDIPLEMYDQLKGPEAAKDGERRRKTAKDGERRRTTAKTRERRRKHGTDSEKITARRDFKKTTARRVFFKNHGARFFFKPRAQFQTMVF